ncbi:hypothetical protein [Synergistes jonesii]|uniref:hypothetical protein n=1 Tax=Synergistes jonesii TaxID=2754 RepID=UPI0024300324|nr:hypothetical protein [Synergistes jonesii]
MKMLCKGCGMEFEAKRSSRKYCSRQCANQHTGILRSNLQNSNSKIKVWSSGGGVQSTAIAALIEQGRLPKPDFGIMVDCGYEKSATLEYMHDVTISRMKQIGVDFRMLNTLDYTNNNLADENGHVNIPAFRLLDNGHISKLHTHCNSTWKVQVTRRWAREMGISNMENWLGISTDEERRAKPSSRKWITLRYPLIELNMSREDCIYYIAQAGWPMPPRSSCVFCPQQDAKSWHLVRNTPEDWKRVLEAEQAIRTAVSNVFLHRKCRPIAELFP